VNDTARESWWRRYRLWLLIVLVVTSIVLVFFVRLHSRRITRLEQRPTPSAATSIPTPVPGPQGPPGSPAISGNLGSSPPRSSPTRPGAPIRPSQPPSGSAQPPPAPPAPLPSPSPSPTCVLVLCIKPVSDGSSTLTMAPMGEWVGWGIAILVVAVFVTFVFQIVEGVKKRQPISRQKGREE
jgi:hypothetical protein